MKQGVFLSGKIPCFLLLVVLKGCRTCILSVKVQIHSKDGGDRDE
jgi:hypothetical protein